jgi:hypothetical protein
MNWNPPTADAVKEIIQADLATCNDQQTAMFERYAVEPYLAPILRYGEMERVFVVARKGDEVIYWEDVEGGFNLSTVSSDGKILQHFCNQDELRFALNAWIEGRGRTVPLGPATSIG